MSIDGNKVMVEPMKEKQEEQEGRRSNDSRQRRAQKQG